MSLGCEDFVHASTLGPESGRVSCFQFVVYDLHEHWSHEHWSHELLKALVPRSWGKFHALKTLRAQGNGIQCGPLVLGMSSSCPWGVGERLAS
mmetsp:Transcript_66360/g.171591  ORF Transcript_66360/g.171591 Transcript_66360/m.171591 type:complete len:93 (+) Transcript_66360:464-742(+)